MRGKAWAGRRHAALCIYGGLSDCLVWRKSDAVNRGHDEELFTCTATPTRRGCDWLDLCFVGQRRVCVKPIKCFKGERFIVVNNLGDIVPTWLTPPLTVIFFLSSCEV